VKESFVWDCISAQKLLDVNDYALAVQVNVHFSNSIMLTLSQDIDEPVASQHTALALVVKSDKENKTDNIPKFTTTIPLNISKPLHTSDHSTFSFASKSTSQIDPHVQVKYNI
jgi:hypothetical protein